MRAAILILVLLTGCGGAGEAPTLQGEVRFSRGGGFATLPEDASPGPPVPDDFGYTVSYDGHTSSAQGTRMPDRCARAIDTFGDVARAHGMR
jgi:hypothetical protein